MRRLGGVITVSLALACGGCNRGGATVDTTLPTTAATATSAMTAEADIATIPVVIDAAYLNRVLAALDRVETEAAHVIVAKKDVGPDAVILLNSIYSDDELREQSSAWTAALTTGSHLDNISPDDPGRRTTVILRTGDRDSDYIALRPLDKSNDPGHHNPSAWMITASLALSDGSEPSNPCTG